VNRRLFYSLKPAVRMNMSSGYLQYLARRRWLRRLCAYFMDSGDFVVAARIASKISRLADKAAALAKVGDFATAFEVSRQIDPADQPTTLTTIAEIAADAGKFDEALHAAELMQHQSDRDEFW